MYFLCICGEEGDLHVLLFRHLEARPPEITSQQVFIDQVTMHQGKTE